MMHRAQSPGSADSAVPFLYLVLNISQGLSSISGEVSCSDSSHRRRLSLMD